MLRDIQTNSKAPVSKSNSRQASFIGEQPRKLADRNGKSFHKKSEHYASLHDIDDLSRSRHIYHRAASKNMTREILRSSQV